VCFFLLSTASPSLSKILTGILRCKMWWCNQCTECNCAIGSFPCRDRLLSTLVTRFPSVKVLLQRADAARWGISLKFHQVSIANYRSHFRAGLPRLHLGGGGGEERPREPLIFQDYGLSSVRILRGSHHALPRRDRRESKRSRLLGLSRDT